MIPASLPENEPQRLEALKNYNIMDSMPEKDFNDIVLLASQICGTPISLVGFIDEKRQWFKAQKGIGGSETERDLTFCAHALLNPEELMVVPDSSKDERFLDNPYVTGEPHVAFYAGIPLVTGDGYPLGTLCVLDNEPRELDEVQKNALKVLGKQIMNIMELRIKRKNLEDRNKQLEQYSYIVAHDLKSPLSGIKALVMMMKDDARIVSFDDLREYFSLLDNASDHLGDMISSLLAYARDNTKQAGEEVDSYALVNDLIRLLFPPGHIRFVVQEDLPVLFTRKLKLLQVFQNLLSNAIKYNDKEEGLIEIGFSDKDDFIEFFVKDNGPGIAEKDTERIFRLFQVTENKSASESSTGIGLNVLKTAVEEQGGRIWVESEPGKGSTFYFLWRK